MRALDFLQLLKLIWKPVFFDSDICKMGKRTLCTMVQNSLILGHQIIHFLTSLIVSEQANKWVMCKQNKQCEASKWMNGANKRANKQVAQYSGPIHWLIWPTVLRFVDVFPRPPPLSSWLIYKPKSSFFKMHSLISTRGYVRRSFH